MSSARVAAVQREAMLAVALDAVVRAALVAGGAVLVLAGVDRAVPLPLALRALLPWLMGAAALGVLAWRLARLRALRDLHAVALWIEREAPALRYALVTRLDPLGAPAAEALDRAIAAVPFEGATRRAAWRPLWQPAATLAVVALGLALLPRGALARVGRPAAGDAVLAARPAGDALAHVAVTVTPPAYSGERAVTLDDAARVAALAGSAVEVQGLATGDPVSASADSLAVAMRSDGRRWRAALRMPLTPRLVRFTQGTRERLLLLEPRPDSAPIVTLTAPARDTILRAPRGTIPLAASLADDIGLTTGWVEVVIASGEGENFRFRTLTLARAALGNARSGALAGRLVLDTLKLEPGDLLHVRAVARDANDVTGPGVGSSETRTLRVARAGEYDSVDVEGAPPPELKGVISERMLIMLAEKLLAQERTLARANFVGESRRIGHDQDALRKQVGDIIFSRLDDKGGEHAHGGADDHDDDGPMTPEKLLAAANAATGAAASEMTDFADGESPVVHINRPLLEAYNAMWDAGRELGVGDPRRALPHMRAALAAIQRARAAERIYLRGRPKEVVVDVAKVRLAGKTDKIGPGTRTPRANEDAAQARRLARFDRALALAATTPAAATDSLLLLRAELLAAAPELAAPLGEAVDRLRAGQDATAALVAARRALAGAGSAAEPLGAWGRLP